MCEKHNPPPCAIFKRPVQIIQWCIKLVVKKSNASESFIFLVWVQKATNRCKNTNLLKTVQFNLSIRYILTSLILHKFWASLDVLPDVLFLLSNHCGASVFRPFAFASRAGDRSSIHRAKQIKVVKTGCDRSSANRSGVGTTCPRRRQYTGMSRVTESVECWRTFTARYPWVSRFGLHRPLWRLYLSEQLSGGTTNHNKQTYKQAFLSYDS